MEANWTAQDFRNVIAELNEDEKREVLEVRPRAGSRGLREMPRHGSGARNESDRPHRDRRMTKGAENYEDAFDR